MTMATSGSDNPARLPASTDSAEVRDGESEGGEVPAGTTAVTLEELVALLETDPGEGRRASEGLESLDVETRLSIIEGLAGVSPGAGVIHLLQVLALSESAETRAAALAVQKNLESKEASALPISGAEAKPWDRAGVPHGSGLPDRVFDSSREIVLVEDQERPRLVNCLVTAVDGMGRGSVAISSSRQAERSTVLFLCHVERGITSAIGQVEEESEAAGALLEQAKTEAGAQGIEGMPELALRLLAGCLSLSGPATARPVMEWLERTLGRGFEPRPLPTPAAEWNPEPVGNAELLLRAQDVLKACPTWLDRSPLTFELAEEVCMREGRVAVDPHRDSGAFRYLFEHRILQRLELYRRMLLWMHWFWACADEPELAGTARILAWQLSDAQFAVPSHPFTVALTTRSLDAARERLGTEDDPRRPTDEPDRSFQSR